MTGVTELERDLDIDPTLLDIVRDELANVPRQRSADVNAAIRAHLGSGFVGTQTQHIVKWREVIGPFQGSVQPTPPATPPATAPATAPTPTPVPARATRSSRAAAPSIGVVE